MNSRMKLSTMIILLVIYGKAHAYDPLTHRIISEQSARVSILNDSNKGPLPAIGLGDNVDDRRYLLPNSRGNTLTIQRLMQDGAEFEDEGTRAQNHFFDPQNGGRRLMLPLFTGEYSSPDWSLENSPDVSGQEYSYKDAKNYFYKGLTGLSRLEREINLGLTFETIGHVIHHLQDMSQPQHVRNDDHCDRYYCALVYRPSRYESFSRDRGIYLPLTGYPIVDYGTFGLPRKFWENSGEGIAEFTSKNFVSVRTNFNTRGGHIFPDDEYPNPSAGQPFIDKRQITDPDLLGPQGQNQPLSGEIWFVGTQIYDQYHSDSQGSNRRTSTYSIFDADLEDAGRDQVFTLNRFNYDAAHQFLIPRAVGYSTGMINYFFRGKIEISAPSGGVFGVVDHAVTKASGEGFTKIKVALKNATPDGGGVPQEMPGGTLVAVAKYIRNSCYQEDLSGEFGGIVDYFGGTITPSGCPIVVYLSGQEEISVSAPRVVASLDRNNLTEFTFDFRDQPIPVDSRDVSIQVIYTGRLGEENDAVVVGAKNISEPTYLAVFNTSDYFQLDGQLYTPEEIRSTPALRDRVDVDHDGDVDDKDYKIDEEAIPDVRFKVGEVYVTEAATLEPRKYFRIVVLADTESPITLEIEGRFPSTIPVPFQVFAISAVETQLSREPAVISALDESRGVYHWFMLFKLKKLGPGVAPDGVLDTLEPVADQGPTPIALVPEWATP